MNMGDLQKYLSTLPAQKLVLRGVDEHRPAPDAAGQVVVDRVTYVDVVHVVDRQAVTRRFPGLRMPEATLAAKAAGHTVVVKSGNIT